MAASYDPTTDVGKVRLRIPDRNVDKPLFDDAEIESFLEFNGGNVLLATAEALEAIAGDPRRLQGYSRGSVRVEPQLAFNLRERAKQLRDTVAQEEAASHAGIIVGTIERTDFWE